MGKIILTKEEISFQQIKEGKWPFVSLYFEEALDFCREWLNGKVNFTLQTSGSTGLPKPISVHRTQMEISAKATREFFNIPENADLLGCLNIQMIAGKMMLVRAMEWNSNIHLIEPSSDPLFTIQPFQKFNFAAMVPLQVAKCLENFDSFQKLINIEYLIIGGAPISSDLKDKVGRISDNIYQTFGMTETVSHVALAKISPDKDLIYRALPGVNFSVSEENQLIISAPMAKEKSLLTHDIVKLYADNSFEWIGRADFIINSGGIKIQSEELEKQISRDIEKIYPSARYFIFGEKNKNFGEIICLVIEKKAGSQNNPEELLKNLNDQMLKYTIPKKVYYVESFVLTASGKINRPATIKKLNT